MKFVKSVFVPVAALGACAAFAQEEETPEAAAPATEVAAAPQKAAPRSAFTTLPFCRVCEGTAEVQMPGKDWAPVEDGKFYPLGSAFRTRGAGKLTLAFGPGSAATISGDASFGTRAQPLGEKTRTVVLGEGTLDLDLASNLPEGSFFVAAPGFTVKNLAGESRYVYEKTAFGDRVVVRCVTGSLGLAGRHFEIPLMRAANEVILTGEHDQLVTVLENTSGDYIVNLDQGVRLVARIAEDGSTEQKAVSEKAEIKLSPKMKVSVHRAVPSVGERMSVFVMAFDAAGNPLGSGVSFCEGRAEVNSGTLVSKSETEADALAKKAAEADEVTEESVDGEVEAESAETAESAAED